MNQEISLQARVDEINALPLLQAIQAILDITPNLTTVLSPNGQRFVSHSNFTSTADLNSLATFYIRCGSRCTEEHAPLKTRLDYLALDPLFGAFYEQTDTMLQEAEESGSITEHYREFEGDCCAHCSGHPAAVIPAGFVDGESLYFEMDEFERFWGEDAQSIGDRYWRDPETNENRGHKKASKEQVEDAISRGFV